MLFWGEKFPKKCTVKVKVKPSLNNMDLCAWRCESDKSVWQKKTFFNAKYSIFYTLASCKNNPTNTKGTSVVKTTLRNYGVQKSITNPPPQKKNPCYASFFLCHFQNVKNVIINSCHSSLSRKKAYTHKTKPFTPNHQFANSPYHSVYISYSIIIN